VITTKENPRFFLRLRMLEFTNGRTEELSRTKEEKPKEQSFARLVKTHLPPSIQVSTHESGHTYHQTVQDPVLRARSGPGAGSFTRRASNPDPEPYR
jgi:hypothetical protein